MMGKVILKCPDHLKGYRENKETICVDEDTADILKLLWENDYHTMKVLRETIDDIDWKILQWQLVEVTK